MNIEKRLEGFLEEVTKYYAKCESGLDKINNIQKSGLDYDEWIKITDKRNNLFEETLKCSKALREIRSAVSRFKKELK
jgi:hypothetical protein